MSSCSHCTSGLPVARNARCKICSFMYEMLRRKKAQTGRQGKRRSSWDCQCGRWVCDTCADRKLQVMLDRAPAAPVEERSWVGIAVAA